MLSNLCYVGHNHRADLSALHVSFGRVACCADHHPDRGSRGLGFGDASAPVPVAAPRPQAPPVVGGQRVAKIAPPKPQPPAGVAIVDPAVAAARVAEARARAAAERAARAELAL